MEYFVVKIQKRMRKFIEIKQNELVSLVSYHELGEYCECTYEEYFVILLAPHKIVDNP